MPSRDYQPEPISTDGIVLPPELAGLTERLAENAHELWAQQRIKEGWTWGPNRDDAAKKHPCLVPYAQLPESEKEYDRQTAMGTLKAILALGYTIVPPADSSTGRPAGATSLRDIARDAAISPQQIRRVWQTQDPERTGRWHHPQWVPQLVRDAQGGTHLDDAFFPLAKAALEFGEAFLALDIAETGLRVLAAHPSNSHPAIHRARSQLGHAKALALARTGSTAAAHELLQFLYEQDKKNPEIACTRT